jgi:hypothetical protein
MESKPAPAEQWGPLSLFHDQIRTAADRIGWPCFLRTDHTSNKHDWKDACFLEKPADVPRHVFNLAAFSECCGMLGLPYTIWAVRELLPTKPVAFCKAYGGMPLCREFRFFVDNGHIRCCHPYWPVQAVEEGLPDRVIDYAELCAGDEAQDLVTLARAAARAVPGQWSIDILDTERGWVVTDMAEAHKSFHWGGCAKAKLFEEAA